MLPEKIEIECNYCGSYIDVAKAVKLNTETGEYEYACEGCAIKWAKKSITIEELETIIGQPDGSIKDDE